MREAGALHGDTMAIADPGDLLAIAAGCRDVALFYWEHPARDVAILGLGAVRELRASGADRFVALSAAATTLLASITGASGPCDRRRVLGGFGFADADTGVDEWREFPAARLVLPRLLWVRDGGRATLTRMWEAERAHECDALLTRATADERPVDIDDAFATTDAKLVPATHTGASWRARVDAARSLIVRGEARKVVLACRRELVASQAIDPAQVVARARATRPACRTFWVRHGRTSFVGSTPELLVRRSGDLVEASALAGSARRGTDPVEDRGLGTGLLCCPKNAREHDLVRTAITAALADSVRQVTMPARPELLSLPEAHHLHTPVRGRVLGSRTVLDLAGALHPTPAVCGVPRQAACDLIARDEPDRGWYAGVIGWMDGRGDGELAVALRSALIEDRHVTLWAGAGIVDGSDADSELAEVEAKMTALFRHLAGRIDERAA
ncbi:MAG: isochorismate synthase [Deltaproteobacteria bacterium]|nr:isochorismate synthase [Deltaproteobacteria bacterium]